jgi:type II secretory pathway predicted ATPase ExeA
MEHLHHFGLAEDPFRNVPRLGLFFDSREHRDALLRVDRGVRQAKGLCLLIGEVGSGKTMIVRRLFESLEEEVFDASMLVVLKGSADALWMLTHFAKQLGVEEPEPEREGLLAQVYEQLAIVREDGRHAVLIIDDAQALAAPETLAEVCGLLKLEYEERPLLSMVLAGVPALEQALLADPVLSRRADVKVRIAPFGAESAAAYLAHRVQRAQGNPAILQPSATAALQALGGGLPGLMNTLADNALFEAFLCGRSQVAPADVERAHRDLGWDGVVARDATHAEPSLAQSTPSAASVEDRLDDTLGQLDTELAAVFEPSVSPEPELVSVADSVVPPAEINVETGPSFLPEEGPPKLEDDESDEIEDLLVELVDD